ncbi:hypothetical protein N7461_009047 [Penicillium sp. DV-2018c]|nr:hypothetical protein N7461_009047 [Penicillium sp. DV-2018c]
MPHSQRCQRPRSQCYVQSRNSRGDTLERVIEVAGLVSRSSRRTGTGVGGNKGEDGTGENWSLKDWRGLQKATHKEDNETTKVPLPGAKKDLMAPLLDSE